MKNPQGSASPDLAAIEREQQARSDQDAIGFAKLIFTQLTAIAGGGIIAIPAFASALLDVEAAFSTLVVVVGLLALSLMLTTTAAFAAFFSSVRRADYHYLIAQACANEAQRDTLLTAAGPVLQSPALASRIAMLEQIAASQRSVAEGHFRWRQRYRKGSIVLAISGFLSLCLGLMGGAAALASVVTIGPQTIPSNLSPDGQAGGVTSE